MSTRCVNIVGGGLAGLIAAVELARQGVKVSVFEAAAEPGGRARTRNVSGFLLNQGPHALYVQGALKRELDRLGVAYSGDRALGGSRKAIARGKLHELPTSLGAIATTSLLGVTEKIAYARVFKSVMDGAGGDGSFGDWLIGQRLSPNVRAAIEAIARLSGYANAPAEVSADSMLDQMRLAAGGTLYLDGGWGTLVDGLHNAAIMAGVDLICGAAVQRVQHDQDGVSLILEDGAAKPADAVILAVGPKEAASLIPESTALAVELREAWPVRANTLDLALSRLPAKAVEFALGIDSPFYLSLHSGSARLAPDGGAVVHVAKYLPLDEDPGRNATEELEAIADLAMPGWRTHEVKRQTLRGMVVANGLPRWDRPRPGVQVADAPAVFIAGDWVGDEGMIGDAAASSAIAAARAALALTSRRVAA